MQNTCQIAAPTVGSAIINARRAGAALSPSLVADTLIRVLNFIEPCGIAAGLRSWDVVDAKLTWANLASGMTERSYSSGELPDST